MKSFSRSANHIGIDMGSSQTRIFSENRLLLDERTVVAVDSKTNEMVGFGTDAIIAIHSGYGWNGQSEMELWWIIITPRGF